MKICCLMMALLIFRQATAGIVRKPPAFSAPVYTNSYLPAVMQVIFHAVEQLKLLQSEEMSQEHSATRPSSTTKYQKPQSTVLETTSAIPITAVTKANKERTEIPILSSTSSLVTEISSHGSFQIYDHLTETAKHVETSTANVPITSNGDREESLEINGETIETGYVTPETNYESREFIREIIEKPNREVQEQESKDEKYSTIGNFFDGTLRNSETSQRDSSQWGTAQLSILETLNNKKIKKPTINSVVDEVYEIVKTTTSSLIEKLDVTDNLEDMTENSMEKLDSIEDEDQETRFTLLGEKVAQVPRPSLNNYLRRAKVPPNRVLQQLANLYDSLSKDARKQGFARFAGYSDEVLKTLQSSAEGGIGPQLKKLLQKMVERNELTRDDAKTKTLETLRELDDLASSLSRDLRRLLPLRYAI